MASYDVKSGDKSTLAVKINSTQTSGITIAAMNINGTLTGWANTLGVMEVTEQGDSTLKREWIYYTGTSVDATTKVATLSGVVRNIARDTTDVTSGGTGVAFTKGAAVRFVVFHDLLNKKANIDRVNTWSAAQTIADTVKWIFGASTNWVRGDGADLKFKDANNAETTLTELTSLAGTDTKARVSAADTTSGFLQGKLPAGNGITMTLGSPGANETLTPSVQIDSDPGLEFNGTALRVKVKSSGGVTRDSNGLSVDTTSTAMLSLSKFFGDGSDSAPTWTSGATLTGTTQYNYTTATIPVSQTVTYTGANKTLVLKTLGDVTINGTLSAAALGGAGGAAGISGAGAGGNGTDGQCILTSTYATFITTKGTPSGGTAGGGGSGIAAGAGAGGGAAAPTLAFNLLNQLFRGVICGAGGAGGTGGTGEAGGAGGAGGGSIVWYIGGNLTLGASSTINCSGAAGVAGTSRNSGSGTAGAGGGGGGGGMVLFIVGGTVTNSGVTTTKGGGAAGAGGAGTGGANNGGAGAAGATGAIMIYSLKDGTLVAA
jgi:hypothetical protein